MFIVEDIEEVDIKGFLDDINNWKAELKNNERDNIRLAVLDSVLDIFFANCLFMMKG